MRAATGLHVHAFDVEHAHAAQATRGLHAHAAHELRVGIEFFFADPTLAHGVSLGHQARDACADGLFVERLGHVKVQTRITGSDGTTVHWVRDQGAKQVCCRVKAAMR